jgi:type VI secretion system protein ImpI
VLRIVVQGVMEVLQARAEIKSQFRMPATRVQASDNNPLKFSPNVETALHTLLVERNRAYMPTTRAFQDAFTDIRNHQLAILHGIRTAYASMLESFDPERLEEVLGGDGRRGLLGGKGRFRDQYSEHFRKLSADPDESFRRLFGEVFAEAYEEQLERLKNTGGPRRA